jgi:CRISPR-associated protein Csm4
MKAVYLYPQSSYRTELKSDTLWGLIIVALSYLYDDDEVQSVVDSFKNGNPLFRISSAMYFQEENGKKQHYFPVPHTDPIDSATIPDNMKSKYKKFKKVTRIDKNTFEILISGQINLKDYFNV